MPKYIKPSHSLVDLCKKMRLLQASVSLAFFAAAEVECVNFPFESDQFTAADVGNFSAIAFGDRSAVGSAYVGPTCKAYPGAAEWPLDDEWSQLNSSLGGALLRPVPAAAACYSGPFEDESRCDFLLQNATRSRFYLDDPLTVLTEWPEGDTCSLASSQTEGSNCTQGGFPVYVVNATTVKHVQIAVNFARNKNIRLVIK